jgi:hypothetical protein
MKVYTLRKRKETFDWINELTMTLIRVLAVHTQYQADTARRLAVETWLQRNGVITITQNKKCYPFSSNNLLIIRLSPQDQPRDSYTGRTRQVEGQGW